MQGLDLGHQLLQRARVVDQVVGRLQPLPAVDLGRQDLLRPGPVDAIPAADPLDLQGLRTVHYQHPVDVTGLAGLQQQKLLFGDAAGSPTASLQDAFGDYVATTGSRTRQAQVDLKAQKGLLEVNQNAKQEVSGVNLDEEAADLVRFQQAYQAAAQVVRAGNTVFDALISAVGR